MIAVIPSLDQIIAVNARVTGMEVSAVRQSVRIGLLDSALHAPVAGFGDADLYPLDSQRLGVLCARLVLNHPFVDGNKRTGFLAMRLAAHLNDVPLEFADQHEVSDWIEGLAARQRSEEEFCEWLGRHMAEVDSG